MRNLLALLLFVPSLCLAQLPDYVPADGLVAWWALDGDGSDQSEQENDGNVFGATPTLDRWGSENAAMYFTSIGDRIEFGEISNDIGLPNVGMTISTWFQGEAYPTSGQSVGQVCSAYYGPGNTLIRLEVVHGISDGPGHHLKYYWRCPNENDEPVSIDEFSTSDWNHYAIVVNPNDGEVRIYLNGSVVPELTSAYSASNDYFGGQSRNWMVGSYHPQINSVPHQFSGSIDDVGVWSRALTEAEIQTLLIGEAPQSGCTDTTACNYDDTANVDDGSCEYGCLYCGEGTVWDSATSICMPSILSEDIAEDCTMMNLQELAQNHLLLVDQLATADSLLAICNGTAEAGADAPWTCGDPVTYWDYDYATVLIGDQCWFAENLATTRYTDGTVIDSGLSNSGWASTTTGAQSAYNDDDTVVSTHGRLYNGYAVDDTRGLCPTNWSVPTDSDFIHLEENLGMPTEEAISLFWRGSDEGQRLKSTTWQNGLDEVGFNALPCGGRNHSSGNFLDDGAIGYWWTQTFNIDGLFYRRMDSTEDRIFRTYPSMNYGFSVRCIKD